MRTDPSATNAARFLTILCFAAASLLTTLGTSTGADAPPSSDTPSVVLVVGAPGEPEFSSNFVHQADLWTKTCAQARARLTLIGLAPPADPPDRERLQQALVAEPKDVTPALWLVFIGHGTFDGKEARFNLRGPDVTASELADWLKPFRRPLVIINTASASAPFLATLSHTNRVLITATRSGHEQNFARFGSYLAEALAAPGSDLDHDGQTSLLEAFLNAGHQVADFYKTEGRLATEHALIDDNGDGLGTPADWFRGVRAIKKPEGGASPDGARAQQMHLVLSPAERALPPAVRAKRDALELEVFRLRESKSQMPQTEYFRRLETLLLELARLQSTNQPAP